MKIAKHDFDTFLILSTLSALYTFYTLYTYRRATFARCDDTTTIVVKLRIMLTEGIP